MIRGFSSAAHLFDGLSHLTTRAASAASKSGPLQGVAAQIRSAASMAWSGKLGSFSPANLAGMAKHHAHKLPTSQAKFAMGSVRAEFLTGLSQLKSMLAHSPANWSNNQGFQGLYHLSPRLSPQGGVQTPWRFDSFTMMSNCRWHDGKGQQWQSSLNQLTGGHTSATNWSNPGANGLQNRLVMDHRTGFQGIEIFNSKTGFHTTSSGLSAPDAGGTQRRTTLVNNNGMVWHESLNARTGEHFSVGNWSKPDMAGNMSRPRLDHKTGKLSYERFAPAGNAAPPPKPDNAPPPKSENAAPPPKPGNTAPPPKPENAAPPPKPEGASSQKTEDTGPPPKADGGSGMPAFDKTATPEQIKATALAALGIDENASQRDLTKAYRKLTLKHHPDKGGNEEDFKSLGAHYAHLQSILPEN